MFNSRDHLLSKGYRKSPPLPPSKKERNNEICVVHFGLGGRGREGWLAL